jgi:hypothetical protein
VAFGPTPSNAAQVAASIEYGFVARPFGLPDDLQPLPGTSLKFLSIKAIDGFLVDAALWQPEAPSTLGSMTTSVTPTTFLIAVATSTPPFNGARKLCLLPRRFACEAFAQEPIHY